MSADDSEIRPIRIHISALSPNLVSDPTDLIKRLAMYGTPVSTLSVHRKELGDMPFGFITLSMSNGKYKLLRAAMNGVKYKGAYMKVEEAKRPDYAARYAKPQSSADNEEQALLQRRRTDLVQLKHYRLVQRLLHYIRRGRYQFGKVDRGTLRHTERDLRINPPTFRVKIGRKTKIVKCQKQKLWGMAKGADQAESGWEFVEADTHEVSDGLTVIGHWINYEGDTVEVVKKDAIVIDDFDELKATVEKTRFELSDYGNSSDFEVVKSKPTEQKLEHQETEEERQQRMENERNYRIMQDLLKAADESTEQKEEKIATFNDDDSDDDDAIYQIINLAASKTATFNENDDDEDDDAIREITVSAAPIAPLAMPTITAEAITNIVPADEPYNSDSDSSGLFDHTGIAPIAIDSAEPEDAGGKRSRKQNHKSESSSEEDASAEDVDEDMSDAPVGGANNAGEDGSDESNHEDLVGSDTDSSDSDSDDDDNDKTEKGKLTATKSKKKKGPKRTVETERLRSLFNADNEKQSFSLFGHESDEEEDDDGDLSVSVENGDDDDEEVADFNIIDATAEQPSATAVTASQPAVKRAMLFPHPESAFLDAQSQFSSAPAKPPLNRSEFEADFYENRGEWAHKARRRRRDVVRTNRRQGLNDSGQSMVGGANDAVTDDMIIDEL
ncbi:hypothetical protein V1512DRAFT_256616 [Lipomyces arxii]|uniref:uncharacterized protein n=1 Tax=Lipomyces arxii TaxID=56418 RepID=UPI0034CD9ACB